MTTKTNMEHCPLGLATRGWVVGDLGERDFRAIRGQGWPAGMEGNQKNGGQEGLQAWTGMDGALALGWSSRRFLSREGCSRGGKVMSRGREGGLARAVTLGWEEGMGPSTLMGHWPRWG